YNCKAQQYRIMPANGSMPELYNTISVEVQQKHGDTFVPLAGKYRLRTSEAGLHNSQVTFSREQLHSREGKINFTFTYKGKEEPLCLRLPILKTIRFNLYADSIKTVLNYYLNVEGV